MRKTIFMGFVLAVAGMVMTGCGQKPEGIVNDVYKSASEKKFENIAAYVLPDSIEKFSEEEAKSFAELVAQGFWQNDYSSFTVDSVVVNPENTEAKFVVKTNFKNGLSFAETGLLRKTANGNWRLMVDKEATDTDDVYSVSNPEKMTPELMRNLHYATVMTLASRGIPQYQVMAAQILQDGILTSADIERALDLLKSAADKNYVPAYLPLARMYDKGYKKVPKDLEKAFEWDLKAAEAGVVRAYGNVGYAYREGEGTMKDFEKAKEWYEKGIAKGDIGSMSGLAYMYLSDFKGFENDNEKAFELYNKAYETAEKAGDMEQCANRAVSIGYCYNLGYGVPKNMDKAMEWYTKAAEAGDEVAMDNLGIIYYYGNDGVQKNYDKAFYWFSKAAKTGLLRAKYKVGECYEYGRGVEKNKAKAREIYRELWDKHNYEDASNALMRLL
ncbi:MAG: SEL1-like repeat protein [Muribaculaceae bacterium]|nr:SEL1-like repeat protein [Muribaculaceae bacterium]